MNLHVKQQPRRSCGFTLLELMVTMAIISILAAISYRTLKADAPKFALQNAQRQIGGIARMARNKAILNGQATRLVVCNDAGDPARYLRFLTVLQETDWGSDVWEQIHQGTFLPEGVFFVPQDAGGGVELVGDRQSEYRTANNTNTDSATMDWSLDADPDAPDPDAAVVEWIYYHFGPNGKLGPHESQPPITNHIVLANGVLAPGGGVNFLEDSASVGVRFRTTGHVYEVETEEAI